jgi:hypothetical protein
MSVLRAIATAIAALVLIAAAHQMVGFGGRVTPVSDQHAPFAAADFDGDGVPDTVYVVSVSAGGALPSEVRTISGLWSSPWRSGVVTKRALAIVLGKTRRKYLIVDPDYFDTPIWNDSDLPLAVAKRGSKAFKEFQAEEVRIRNDILVAGTEAGIDTALYWNGKTFALFEPVEEP